MKGVQSISFHTWTNGLMLQNTSQSDKNVTRLVSTRGRFENLAPPLPSSKIYIMRYLHQAICILVTLVCFILESPLWPPKLRGQCPSAPLHPILLRVINYLAFLTIFLFTTEVLFNLQIIPPLFAFRIYVMTIKRIVYRTKKSYLNLPKQIFLRYCCLLIILMHVTTHSGHLQLW